MKGSSYDPENRRYPSTSISALFRASPPRPRKPNTLRTYSPQEATLLEEARVEFQASESQRRDMTKGGKIRGPSIRVEGRKPR